MCGYEWSETENKENMEAQITSFTLVPCFMTNEVPFTFKSLITVTESPSTSS
jgi:hypothetical protein